MGKKPVTGGFTLVEIMTAMTVLFIGCFFVFRMFHLALYSSGSIGDETLAAIIAKKRIEEIRGWAYNQPGEKSNYINGDWKKFITSFCDPQFSKFAVDTDIAIKPLFSPSSGISPSKSLSSSARCIKVTVSWNSATGKKNVTLLTIMGEPRREAANIKVLPDSEVNVNAFAETNFTAVGYDSENKEIPDLAFRWGVQPITGTGSISYSGLGSSAVFKNSLGMAPDGGETATGGLCKVYAISRVYGKDMEKYSNELSLAAGIKLPPKPPGKDDDDDDDKKK